MRACYNVALGNACYCILSWINTQVYPQGGPVQGYFSAWFITLKIWQLPSIQARTRRKWVVHADPRGAQMAVAQDSRHVHRCLCGHTGG